jgi:hypothetical protein
MMTLVRTCLRKRKQTLKKKSKAAEQESGRAYAKQVFSPSFPSTRPFHPSSHTDRCCAFEITSPSVPPCVLGRSSVQEAYRQRQGPHAHLQPLSRPVCVPHLPNDRLGDVLDGARHLPHAHLPAAAVLEQVRAVGAVPHLAVAPAGGDAFRLGSGAELPDELNKYFEVVKVVPLQCIVAPSYSLLEYTTVDTPGLTL